MKPSHDVGMNIPVAATDLGGWIFSTSGEDQQKCAKLLDVRACGLVLSAGTVFIA